MTQHPYVGLAGIIDKSSTLADNRWHGVRCMIAAVIGDRAIVVTESGAHTPIDLVHFVAEDAAEARRRLTESARNGVDEHTPDLDRCCYYEGGTRCDGPNNLCGLCFRHHDIIERKARGDAGLTEPGREPERYQTWIDDCAIRPDDHPDNPPAGYVGAGPWEPGNIAPGSVQGADYEWHPVMMQARRRPLRRVQG